VDGVWHVVQVFNVEPLWAVAPWQPAPAAAVPQPAADWMVVMSAPGSWHVQQVAAAPLWGCASKPVWQVWHWAFDTLAELYGTLVWQEPQLVPPCE
jgi:hypothetical protein